MAGSARPAVDRGESRPLLLMLTPFVIGLIALVVVPAAVTFGLALTEYDLIRPARWVGLGNLRELITDPVFRIALGNSVGFALIAVPLRLLVALALALVLHRRAAGVGTARTAAALPTAVPEVAYGLLWLWLLNPIYGPINLLLTLGGDGDSMIFGLTPPQWLTQPGDARAGIILMSLFTIAEAFVVLLVARQSVPSEVYELAAVEDAGAFAVFRRITLPLMAPALLLILARDLILSFQVSFIPALVVTNGGPAPYATTYLPLFVYRNAFEYLRYGYAAAATLLMLLLTVAVLAVQWLLVRRYRHLLAPL
jgi:multiple sugar transport system permease protein